MTTVYEQARGTMVKTRYESITKKRLDKTPVSEVKKYSFHVVLLQRLCYLSAKKVITGYTILENEEL